MDFIVGAVLCDEALVLPLAGIAFDERLRESKSSFGGGYDGGRGLPKRGYHGGRGYDGGRGLPKRGYEAVAMK